MRHESTEYREALEWIHGMGRFGIKPGLERVAALLEMLGNPHQTLSFVHIGGTNGKGSTAAMLASILRTAGYQIGLYTSPYLLSFTNRMAVNGSDIGPEELVGLVREIRPLIEKIKIDPNLGQPTEFEVVTVLALTYFARRKVDLVVLEVGLGGRLDATNVVDPLFSIITNVSLEHTAVLGDTVEAIAAEKAGIIKKERPLLTSAEDEKVIKLLKERCRKLNSPFYRVYPALPDSREQAPAPVAVLEKIAAEGQYFSYTGFSRHLERLFIPLRGLYQLTNAATAVAAAELLSGMGFSAGQENLRRGLAATEWPGRLERLHEKPLLIMDGAHNPASMEKLAGSLPLYFKYRRLILVLGILADKDMKAMLGHILPLADRVVFTRPVLPRAAEPRDVAHFASENFSLAGPPVILENYREALDWALEEAEPDDAVLVTGSLYTVSDLRAYWMGKNIFTESGKQKPVKDG
ncbi:MAG TPA: bifunctional folylpolyglutamate synthase/dihydrofolate synthase [Firmicutes bacterium]|nr:bifunctional folylpolyglutamate synthase/dihydrofolate synthase [Bacillota bacterium]